jgi:hypothetical protein
MSFPYKNPISSLQVGTTQSVPLSNTYGLGYSVNNIGGHMEVYSLNDLIYTIPTGTTGSVEYSGNTIPIEFTKGDGNVWSPDVLTLASDNISSGRRRLGMLVYVYEMDQLYQFYISGYTSLFNAATASTNCVSISEFGTLVRNNTPEGQSFINAWTASTIEGVSGYTSANSVWRKFTYLSLSGGTVFGNTIFTSGLTANTLTVTGLTQTSGLTSTGGITFPQKTINSSYTAVTSDYMIDITGGTFNVQLPTAVGVQGKLLAVKNNGGGAVTVFPFGSEKIDDKNFLILSETNSVQLISNGNQWIISGQDRSTVNNSTGVFEFSGMSRVSNTQFSVARVRGWITDTTTNPLSPQIYYVDYSGGTHTDNYVTTAFETFVYLTSGATIQQQPTPLTEQQRRQNIFLGKIGHPQKTAINLVFSQPDYVISPLAQLRDMFVPINLINGGVYPSPNGANLSFNNSAGYIYGLGINFSSDSLNPNALAISGGSPTTFQYRTSTGGSVSDVTLIDPTTWDVNGVATPISGVKSTNQRIYLLQNGTFRVQYGQTEYNQLSTAIAAIQTEVFTVFPNFTNNAVLIGILSVTSNCTDLTDTSKARFLLVSKFGETVGAAGGIGTTTLQQAYNNSSEPEITINSTLDGLSIQNGTGNPDNTTQLLQGKNTAGTVTSFIRADGLISGSTLSTPGFTANTNGLTATTISATTYYNLPISGLTQGTNITITNNGSGNYTISSTGGGGGSFSGTTGYIPKWSGSTNLTDSLIQDNGTTVSIGSPSSAAAILEVASTSQGVLFPRMTESQRLAISSPPIGLIVYQTDTTDGLYIYKVGGWVQII